MDYVVPKSTRFIDYKICSHHRTGLNNDGNADNTQAALYSIPSELHVSHCEITKAPMLRETGQGPSAIVVMWESNSKAHQTTLEWYWEPGDPFFIEPVQTTYVNHCHFVHKATINFGERLFAGSNNLNLNRTVLFYRVSCGRTETSFYRYETPVKYDLHKNLLPSTRIAVLSDNQYGANVMRHILHELPDFSPDLLLFGGDVVNRGYLIDEWGMYFWRPLEDAEIGQTTPIVIARGNHDGESSIAHAFTAPPINKDWFAFSHGAVRYIILDSNAESSAAPKQKIWLINELNGAESRNALFRCVDF